MAQTNPEQACGFVVHFTVNLRGEWSPMVLGCTLPRGHNGDHSVLIELPEQ